ncbi:MAG TPA: serine/threonine-protein kinase [Acidobacteriota bacterium]|nr:serine/threonine-protein kinase [Acidobacteriota bacterium]
MTPERWRLVRLILDQALEVEHSARPAYLDQACAADPPLRSEVESLIASLERAGDFLENPSDTPEDFGEAWIGKRIGRYQILEEIGRGGMGGVYRAVRTDDYEQQVAIKLIKRGLDTDFILRRFLTERQILARLEHPNIARLLDGGATEDGRPYFVMEYIVGRPLHEYCDQQRLSITDRLNLFRTVCSAVQYAHQSLIIHRDLKPGNILVTSQGVPKLLDFGIAKILSPNLDIASTLQTNAVVKLLTPEYASPEQLRGEMTTTATDVYSLGVVLHELLTGHRPYRFPSRLPEEVVRIVTDTEAQRPSVVIRRVEDVSGHTGGSVQLTPDVVSSTREGSPAKLRRRLEGDLDNIVLMALRKEPERRYGSVEKLSEDIRRHLEGLPVIARTDTFAYRSSRFIKRHKAAVAAATLLFVSLLGGVLATLRQAHISAIQRRTAEQRLKDVRALASSNLFELHDAIQQLPGSAAARHLVIQRGVEYLDKLSKEATGDRDLMSELAVGYGRLARLQGNFSGPGIGDSKAALTSYQKALAIRDSLVSNSPDDFRMAEAEVSLSGDYVLCLLKTGKTGEALRTAQHALGMAEAVARSLPYDAEARIEEVQAHLLLASVLGGNGSSPSTRDISGAIGHDSEAIRLLQQLAPGEQSPPARRAALTADLSLAFHLSKARKFAESAKAFDQLLSVEKGNQSIDRVYTLALNWRGMMLERLGDQRKALEDYENLFRVTRSIADSDPRDLVARLDFDIARAHIGVQGARLGDKAAGKKLLDASVEDAERLLASDPTESFYTSLLAIGYSYQAEILSSMGDQNGALTRLSRALATAVATSQYDSEDLEARLKVAKIHATLGVVLARALRYAQAQQEFKSALESSREILRARPQDSETLYLSKMVRNNAASLKQCSVGTVCKSVRDLRLPTLLN